LDVVFAFFELFLLADEAFASFLGFDLELERFVEEPSGGLFDLI